MKEFIANNIKGLKPSLLNTFFDEVSSLKDVTSLSVGEPDFDTPWHISEKGILAIEDGRTFYSPSAGIPELRKAIVRHIEKTYRACYTLQDVVITNGASEAIDLCLRALINPGDEIILTDPGYVSYEPLVILNGGKPVHLVTDKRDGFVPKADKIEALITDKTKAIILNYPNNPTGAVLDDGTIRAIIDVCLKHDIIVISDEIYSDLVYTKESVSFLSYPGIRSHLLYINGLSKSYAMTGWRIGYILGEEALLSRIKIIHQYSTMCASIISQFAGVEAVLNGDKDIRRMRIQYLRRRNYVLQRLLAMGLDVNEPNGAFYVYPSIETTGLTSLDFCSRLLKEEKLAVIPGNAFGDAGEGHIRISYAYSLEDLKTGLDKLEDFLTKIRR